MKRLSVVCDTVADDIFTSRINRSKTTDLKRVKVLDKEGGLRDLDALAEVTSATSVAQLATIITQRDYPAFSSFLRQSYRSALMNIQRKCLSKCADEFYSAHTLYWELTGGYANG